MENTEQNAVKILPFESISQVANKSINYIKARKNHSIVSLKTRWDKFNKATGGIEPNMIFTIAGISGSGNSAFYFKYFKYYLTLILEYDNILYQREGSKVYELSFNAKRGAYVSSILYNGAEIYLERKYLRYKEFCRLYKGLYRELSSKYGKDRKVNSVVNSQIAEG